VADDEATTVGDGDGATGVADGVAVAGVGDGVAGAGDGDGTAETAGDGTAEASGVGDGDSAMAGAPPAIGKRATSTAASATTMSAPSATWFVRRSRPSPATEAGRAPWSRTIGVVRVSAHLVVVTSPAVAPPARSLAAANVAQVRWSSEVHSRRCLSSEIGVAGRIAAQRWSRLATDARDAPSAMRR
jgi:hypothetical protein